MLPEDKEEERNLPLLKASSHLDHKTPKCFLPRMVDLGSRKEHYIFWEKSKAIKEKTIS